MLFTVSQWICWFRHVCDYATFTLTFVVTYPSWQTIVQQTKLTDPHGSNEGHSQVRILSRRGFSFWQLGHAIPMPPAVATVTSQLFFFCVCTSVCGVQAHQPLCDPRTLAACFVPEIKTVLSTKDKENGVNAWLPLHNDNELIFKWCSTFFFFFSIQHVLRMSDNLQPIKM